MTQNNPTKQFTGFTIIEVLVIIVVLGILISVGAVSYYNTQVWSQNNTRANEMQQWASIFDLYKSRYGGYPIMPTSDGTTYYCLGAFTDFSAKCGQYTLSPGSTTISAASSSTLIDEVKKVSKIPEHTSSPIDGKLIGPFLRLTQVTVASTVTTTVDIIGIFQGSTCPDSPGISAVSPATTHVAGVSGVIECKLTKSMTYTL